ncbi:hypothetical protein R3P38DRAFT_3087200 [Favolaschia claudopus]|uniref:DUF1688-domain-containing protein n=1 Tax=Favolaschia claudopus TaxID=2862362 RepID=A0AAV9ZTW0_9AGAR
MTPTETAEYLRTLPAIRDRCNRVFELAPANKLQYFEYHPENESAVTAFCVDIIHKAYGTDYDRIPPHGRWRHCDAHHPRIEPILAQWAIGSSALDLEEVTARLIDLFTVSVLLDAGAGPHWIYTEPGSGVQFRRSEGLGVAVVHMFAAGLFSGNNDQPCQVDATGLASIVPAAFATAFQVSESNPMVGLEGRTALLARLADALRASPQFFGSDARPGGLVAHLKTQSTTSNGQTEIPMTALWHALITGLQPIWPPGRGVLAGLPLGDVWPCPSLRATVGDEPGGDLVPFHKLTGWLAYSLREPLERILGWRIKDGDLQTGLPEYRNAEPIPRDAATGIPRVPPSHPAIVEWRAMTVVLLDRALPALRSALPAPEALHGTGGRAIAKRLRPGKDGEEGGGPPIEIISDGTVF